MQQGISSKLDWSRMLGFEQVAADRAPADKIGSKAGMKPTTIGSKAGLKPAAIPVKVGVKIGTKPGLKPVN